MKNEKFAALDRTEKLLRIEPTITCKAGAIAYLVLLSCRQKLELRSLTRIFEQNQKNSMALRHNIHRVVFMS